MAVALPFVAGLLIWLHLMHWGRCWRRAAVYAALAWGALIVGITELLSAATELAFVPVTIVWATIAFLLTIECAWQTFRIGSVADLVRKRRQTLRYLAAAWNWRRSLPWGHAAAIAAIALVVLATALLSPPNTFDSLTYHMPRVMHWIAQRSVRHFPTAIDRQLWSPPWSEFVVAQFQILSGGDRFAGLVQFGSMLVGLVAVSLIAGQLGAPRRIQILAALVAATIPMGILQASSTQTDWNVACWIACFTLAVLDLRGTAAHENPPRKARGITEWLGIVSAGTALGLALLTKGTAILFCAPCGIWLAVSLIHRRRWMAVPQLAVVLSVALLLNAAHFARNLEQFGSALSPARPSAWLRNESFDPRIVVSNLLRGTALHFHTRSHVLDDLLLVRPITRLHEWMRIGINDPRSTYLDIPFQIPKLSTDEDYAGNPLHLLLMIVALVALTITAIRSRNRTLAIYLACIVAMAILFAGVLKWQVWGSRLQLPIFVCGAPLIAIAFWQRLTLRAAAAWSVGLILFALPFLLAGSPRALLGQGSILTTSRGSLYFQKLPVVSSAYEEAARRIRAGGFHDVGLIADYNAPEYALWISLNPSGSGAIQIRHVAPLEPQLTTWNWPAQRPAEIILATKPTEVYELSLAGRSYAKTWSRDGLELFEPLGPTSEKTLAVLPTNAKK